MIVSCGLVNIFQWHFLDTIFVEKGNKSNNKEITYFSSI